MPGISRSTGIPIKWIRGISGSAGLSEDEEMLVSAICISGGTMRKCIMVLMLAALCCFSGCGSRSDVKTENFPDDQSNVSTAAESAETDDQSNVSTAAETASPDDKNNTGTAAETAESEESEVDRNNKKIIADALGVEENARNIRFIMNSLNTIPVGRIQSALLTKENGEDVLDLTTEDQKSYRVYLTGSKKVDAVKDLETGEWLITSER